MKSNYAPLAYRRILKDIQYEFEFLIINKMLFLFLRPSKIVPLISKTHRIYSSLKRSTEAATKICH